MLVAIMVPLALAILLFSYILIRAAIAKRTVPNLEALVVGIVVNFFDTLGIGSFAPTTAWLKFRKHGARPADSADHAGRPDAAGDGRKRSSS